MARDPPSLLASSELRDMSLKPTSIRQAQITIIHPQLRDLILPVQRGRVLYPRGLGIDEMSWTPAGDQDEDDDDGYGMHLDRPKTKEEKETTKPFVKLSFNPNCLTTSRGVLAAGGQHGELYICDLSTPSSGRETLTPLRPFHISQTLPTRSINNSILILPTWQSEWHAHADRRRVGQLGRGTREWDELDEDGRELGRWDSKKGRWIIPESLEEEEEVWQDARMWNDDADEAVMEIDEDDDRPTSPATYPNTVPFFHAPRIPNLPPSPVQHTRRMSSISDRPRDTRAVRQSFSAYTSPAARGPQIVTSQSSSSRSQSMSLPFPPRPPSRISSNSKSSRYPTESFDSRLKPRSTSTASRTRIIQPPEPRILVSNNDQTVKVFCLRSSSPSSTSASPAPPSDNTTRVDSNVNLSPAARRQRDLITMDRILNSVSRQVLPPAPTFYGGRLGWDSVAANEGIRANRDILTHPSNGNTNERDAFRAALRAGDANAAAAAAGISSVSRSSRGQNASTSNNVPDLRMQDSDIRTALEEHEEERRLQRIGGQRFRTAINHSSISPDLSMMVSVGDSTEVYLFQVMQGGEEFRKIKTLSAATDSGFSTAWSKDGRKFAVASQDGQVTVWDHRSTRPLAIFHSSTDESSSLFVPDLHGSSEATRARSARARAGAAAGNLQGDDGMGMVLVDPTSGDVRMGSSNSGREAARVVKFSPEGSCRDLMVFSEEHSNIHIIDAKTFNSHVVLPVPFEPSNHKRGVENMAARREGRGMSWGIAGLAFDPTGNWLYSGTESTVVEWDMRGLGSGEGGYWGLA